MVVVGADVHKRTHTFVAVDAVGKKLGESGRVGHLLGASSGLAVGVGTFRC